MILATWGAMQEPVGAAPPPLEESAAEARLLHLFNGVDADGDERLSRQELYRAHKSTAPPVEEGGMPGLDVRIWGHFDRDRDGFVSRAEAVARGGAMFREANANGDGVLTYAERRRRQENGFFAACRARTEACRQAERTAERYRANLEKGGVALERFDWSTRARFRFNSGIGEPRYEAVRDAASWRRLWGRITARQGPAPVFPYVDFKRDMVLVAAMGQRATGGYSIQIESVRFSGPDLVATVIRTSPGRRCGTAQAVSAPADLVMVPTSPKRIRWNIKDRVTDCS